jgi:hypothetical protein
MSFATKTFCLDSFLIGLCRRPVYHKCAALNSTPDWLCFNRRLAYRDSGARPDETGRSPSDALLVLFWQRENEERGSGLREMVFSFGPEIRNKTFSRRPPA